MDVVLKQGLLRKAPGADGRPLSTLFNKLDSNKWCVLAVRGGKPYFESYDKEEEMFTGSLSNSLDLSQCKQVTYTLSKRTKTYSFCLILPFKVVHLTATRRDQLLSWVSAIETCLQKLGIIEIRNDDHVYSFCPAVVNMKGHSKEAGDEEELLGAVGGSETTEYSTAEDMNSLDEDGDEIFGHIGDNQIKYLQQKARQNSEKFDFDWTKEPTSEPKNEMKDVETRTDQEEFSGSCDFQDPLFWERNKLSDNNDNQNAGDIDSDGEYCGLTEFAQLRVKKSSPQPASQSDTSNNSKNQNMSHSSEKLTVNLPQPTGNCSSTTPPSSNSVESKTINENNYAPFPVREPAPNLINFNDYGTRPSKTTSNNFEEPLRPLPQPRKLSQLSPTENSIERNDTLSEQPHKESSSNGLKVVPLNDNKISSSSLDSPPVPIPRRNKTNTKPEEEDNFYEGIFPPTDNVASAPDVPPRFDSLNLNKPSSPSNRISNFITSPSIDPDFDFSTDLRSLKNSQPSIPPLPPRNKMKSEELHGQKDQPPLPVRNTVKSEEVNAGKQPLPPARKNSTELPPPIPSRFGSVRGVPSYNSAETSDIRTPRRQLSNRMRLDRAQSFHTVISLKQNQIEMLKEEILLPSISVHIKKEHFQGLALVDSFNGVWVCGWNLVDFPRLHDKFHIGDKILSVNNVPCLNASSYYKQIKHSDNSTVDIQLKRLPKACVFVMRRCAEGESIGIKREGGTAEIIYVDPDGLAGRHGLPLKSHNMVGDSLCNWVITEINSLTLNLFFKDMEIEHRLGAVGKDITIVVQPSDLINELKKHLKKLRNYKSYLIK